MARERLDLKGQNLSLTDPATKQNFQIEKAVNITDDCPNREIPERQILLLYSVTSVGILFEVRHCFKNRDNGVTGHWLIGKLNDLSDPILTIFLRFALKFGLSPETLRDLVHQHAPAVPTAAII